MNINSYISQHQQRLEKTLHTLLPAQNNELHLAMRYATLQAGKRFRPLLVYTTGEALGADAHTLDYVAAAVELVHCYSLIHDDLPAMDDDSVRRGKPSCHKAFSEATAILAGDALLTLAFQTLTDESLTIPETTQLAIIRQLSNASGANGMVLGQALDLHPEDIVNVESITNVHLHKTGALIQASILMGALAANCEDNNLLQHLTNFGHDLGLGYQIQDDVLDLETSAECIEIAAEENSSENYNLSNLLGTEAAQSEARRFYQSSLDKLAAIQLQASPIAEFTRYMMDRES